MSCPRLISRIRNSRNIGDSLITLNTNFYVLDTLLCDLKERVESLVEVRTFFYYGPNQFSGDRAATDMRDNETNRPSNTTIQNFVNSTSELNLAGVSKQYDVVNIVYQKTGFKSNSRERSITGTATASRYINADEYNSSFNFTTPVPWATTVPDRYDVYVPVFIIWKLTHNGLRYTVDDGFPICSYEYQPL